VAGQLFRDRRGIPVRRHTVEQGDRHVFAQRCTATGVSATRGNPVDRIAALRSPRDLDGPVPGGPAGVAIEPASTGRQRRLVQLHQVVELREADWPSSATSCAIPSASDWPASRRAPVVGPAAGHHEDARSTRQASMDRRRRSSRGPRYGAPWASSSSRSGRHTEVVISAGDHDRSHRSAATLPAADRRRGRRAAPSSGQPAGRASHVRVVPAR
jgi:hypothetical protein